MKQRIHFLIACTLAIAMLAALSAVLPAKVPSAKADAVTGYSTVQVLAFGSATTTQSSSVLVQPYGQADCYARTTQAISPTTEQTVTFALSHSADNAHWVSLYSFADQITDSIDFTRTVLYGNYLKAEATLGSTGRPVTGSVVCVLKNVQ